jgi:hypothetical protein
VLTVADDVGGNALGDRLHPTADDEAAVVAAGHERLDDDGAPLRLPARDVERLVDLVPRLEVQAYPSSVVAVERLDTTG